MQQFDFTLVSTAKTSTTPSHCPTIVTTPSVNVLDSLSSPATATNKLFLSLTPDQIASPLNPSAMKDDEALKSVLSQITEYDFADDGTLTITLPSVPTPSIDKAVDINVLVPVNWQASVDSAFALEKVTSGAPKPSKRRLTSHRLLTGEDIVKQKIMEENEKKLKEEAKLKRKLDREQNKINKQNKKVRKV